MAKLVLRYPNNVIREVDFEQPHYRIGGAADNDLVLEGEGIAPHQAEILTSDGIYAITDLSEDKSTTVNGKKFEKISITYGDRIAFGNIIGLFYPAQKKKVGERAKLALYIGAGAGVILFSIAIIFILTTRQISSVVSERIGTPLPYGELPAQPLEPGKKEEAAQKVLPGREITLPEGAAPSERGAGLGGLFERGRISLPEPTPSEIEKRSAVAVPLGVGRLFFRKIPVVVAPLTVVEPTPPETVTGIETTAEPEVSGEILEEEGPQLQEEKGFFSAILSPFRRLFGAREAAPVTPLEEEYEAVRVPGPSGRIAEVSVPATTLLPEAAPKPAPQDIQRVTDPLKVIRNLDVPGIRETSIEAEPVYSKKEIEQYGDGTLFDTISVSQVEDVNVGILWQYPGLPTETGIIVRSGTVGRVDGDKSYDFIFGTRSGELIVLSGASGDEIIKEELSGPFYEPVFVDVNNDGVKEIVITYEKGDIEIITPTLERVWHYRGTERITAMPLIIDINGDRALDIVFATFDMEVVALDGRTGFELWRFFDAESEIIFTPAGVDINGDGVRDVVFVTVRGFLYAVDGKSGWGLWKSEIFGRPAGPCSVGDLDGDGVEELVNLTKSGTLTAHRKDGKLLFTSQLDGTFSTAPSLGDVDGDGKNEIVMLDDNGMIRVVEGATRRMKWNFETKEGFSTGRIAVVDIDADGGMDVIALTASGALFVLQGKTGSVMAQYSIGGYVLSTPIVFDINRDRIDEIIVSSYRGDVIALQVSDTRKGLFSLKKSFWIGANHDPFNTGYSSFYRLKNPWK